MSEPNIKTKRLTITGDFECFDETDKAIYIVDASHTDYGVENVLLYVPDYDRLFIGMGWHGWQEDGDVICDFISGAPSKKKVMERWIDQ